MSAYYLWQPRRVENTRSLVVFVVTNGDVTEGIPESKEFVNLALDIAEINGGAGEYSYTPYRCYYFSEYLESDEWADKWPVVWRYNVHLKEETDKIPLLDEEYVGMDALVEGKMFFPDLEKQIGCLVVSDFIKADYITHLIEDINIVLDKEYQGFKKPECLILSKTNDLFQCHFDLGTFDNSFFSEGAAYALEIIRLCKKNKGKTHFEDIL